VWNQPLPRHPAKRTADQDLADHRPHGERTLIHSPTLAQARPGQQVRGWGNLYPLRAPPPRDPSGCFGELWSLTQHDGAFAKKPTFVSAVEWALRRDPTLGVVGDVLRQRHGDPAARIDPAQVARLLMLVRARLAEAHDAPS
jgi:hypothetical protein